MDQLRKSSSKYLFFVSFLAAILFTVTWKAASQRIESNYFGTPLTFPADTIPSKDTLPSTDTVPHRTGITSAAPTLLPGNDSLRQKTDTFSVKLSKDSFDEPVRYAAEDSAV